MEQTKEQYRSERRAYLVARAHALGYFADIEEDIIKLEAALKSYLSSDQDWEEAKLSEEMKAIRQKNRTESRLDKRDE
jgi:hypothetical protein